MCIRNGVDMKLPALFEQRMKDLLQEEYEEYVKCFDEKHYGGLRVNTLKISCEEFETICPFKIKKIPWVSNGYFYQLEEQPARHPYYFAGLYYIQEPSAMIPASLLPVKPGDKVLDVCAAPGGKSTELGAKLKGEGLLVANDISNSRAKALLKNVELIGVRNAMVVSEAPSKLVKSFEGFFDKILVDAPCSGEGMFRKSPAIMKNWEQCGVDYYSKLQKEIILDVARMLKPGGFLVYSTCTFSPEENEGTMKFLLEHFPEFKIVDALQLAKEIYGDVVEYEGFDFGKPEWADAPESVTHCLRLWPHKINGEGHFVALLQKGESEDTIEDMITQCRESLNVTVAEYIGNKKKQNIKELMKKSSIQLSDEAIEFLEALELPLDDGVLKLRGELLYYLPSAFSNNQGLRTLRHGLLLGEMKKNRFEPSQALACTMNINNYSNVVNLSKENGNVVRYLKCETIDIDDTQIISYQTKEGKEVIFYPKDGWVLVCVDSYPLGWGKLSKGSIKNKYYSGWRWL